MAYNDNPAYLKLSGGTMTGTLTLSGNPSNANDAANKNYVDAVIAGLDFKGTCTCATTAALNANYVNGVLGVGATLINAGALSALTIDGVTPTLNQRILVKNQASSFQNGIYTITTLGTGAIAWILTRAIDYDQIAEVLPGDIVPVQSGTVNTDTTWLQTATVATMGTDAITFSQFSSGPITTTQNAVLVGGANNSIASTAVGSTGQILQGNTAAAPTYSTATFPSTATGTGKILIADGTNWVASTPTYPNAASTALKHIKSDGTNFVTTTVTYPDASVTAGKVIVSDGTNYIASTPTFPNASATAGKAIVSDGTNWIASTPTFPNASATSGKIIVSDGTNWIASTPTYPNASATSGKIIISDGTNFISSTPTFPNASGTSGNVLTSNGTNFVSSGPPGGLITLTGALTNAQIKALHGTPVQVLAGPGAGSVICILQAQAKMVYGGTNVFTAGAAQTISLYYGTTQAIVAVMPNAQLVAAATQFTNMTGTVENIISLANTTVDNIAINLYNPIATEITGNAANNNTITWRIVYCVVAI